MAVNVALIITVSVLGVCALVAVGIGLYCWWRSSAQASYAKRAPRELMDLEAAQDGDVTWEDIQNEKNPQRRAAMKTQMMRQKARKNPKFHQEKVKVSGDAQTLSDQARVAQIEADARQAAYYEVYGPNMYPSVTACHSPGVSQNYGEVGSTYASNQTVPYFTGYGCRH